MCLTSIVQNFLFSFSPLICGLAINVFDERAPLDFLTRTIPTGSRLSLSRKL